MCARLARGCAGAQRRDPVRVEKLLDQPLTDFDSQYQSCVMQTVHMAKAFVPAMIERSYGRIVVINTECAALAEANCSAYTAAKRGLDGIVRCLAKEVGANGITVNQVAPGWTVSERDRENHTEVQGVYDSTVPLTARNGSGNCTDGRVLASDLASYTHGGVIPVAVGA